MKFLPSEWFTEGGFYENNNPMILPLMALITVGIIIWIQRSRNQALIEENEAMEYFSIFVKGIYFREHDFCLLSGCLLPRRVQNGQNRQRTWSCRHFRVRHHRAHQLSPENYVLKEALAWLNSITPTWI